MSVILDVSYTVSIWISAAVAITYTMLGGLYSVAYTDIIQLILMFFSAVGQKEKHPFIYVPPPQPTPITLTLSHYQTGGEFWESTKFDYLIIWLCVCLQRERS